MPTYTAYGLVISSDLTLPNVVPAEGEPDIVVRVGEVPLRPDEDYAVHLYYGLGPGVVHYVWRGVGTFRVSEGREILVEPAPDAEAAAGANLLLGPLLAIAMHQRGRLVLHASGVEMGGAVIGFAAETGQGKSTTAAAFIRAGYPLVADDLLAVMLDDDGGASVYPANPQMKLWPASIAALGGEHEDLPRVIGPRDKRYYDVGGRMSGGRMRLAALYTLEFGEADAIRHLTPAEALMELVRNSYCITLVRQMGDEGRHFRQCADLAARVPARRLIRRQGLERLGEIVEMVRGERRGRDRIEE